MFDHILVPLDRSALAECALPHAAAMAHLFDSRMTLLHVLDAPRRVGALVSADPLDWQLRRAEAESYLHGIAQQLEETGVSVDPQLAEGDAAEQIIELSQASNADLILLSSHGYSGLSEWNISSVVQKVAWRAYTSLMIVRAHQTAALDSYLPYKRVLAPMDGSQRAEYILPAATQLTAQGAHLLLAHVVHRPEMPRRTPLRREDNDLANRYVEYNSVEAEQYLSELGSRLPGAVETRVLVSDHVISTLHELASQEAIDLVLTSAHGYSGQARWPFGGVVSSFITYGETPLLVVQDAPPLANSTSMFRPRVTETVTREIQGFRGMKG